MEEKKKIKIETIIIIIAIIVIVGLVGVLVINSSKLKKANSEISKITGSDKKEITAEEFKSIISTKNFTINVPRDVLTEEAIKAAGIEKGYITREIEDQEYRINFFDMKDDNSQKYFYYDAINTIRVEDNGNIEETLEKSMNHTKYTALTNGKYIVVSRIGNTLIWGTINADEKQKLIDVLNEMGY